MQIFKNTATIEQKLQKVERLLQDLKLAIVWNGRLEVTDYENKDQGYIMDVENRDKSTVLPRCVESEKIIVVDN